MAHRAGHFKGITIVSMLLAAASMSTRLTAQENAQSVHAIITPFQDHHANIRWDDAIQISRQRFIILLYQNAAAVYSEAVFTNAGQDTLAAELAIPSTGYGITLGGEHIFNATMFNPRVWVEGEKQAVRTEETEEAEWYTVKPWFAAGASKIVKALFWIPTPLSLMDAEPPPDTAGIAAGERHWLLRLSDAAAWKDDIDDIEVVAILKDGLKTDNCRLEFHPRIGEAQDSTIRWSYQNVGPAESENIHCSYNTTGIGATALATLETLSEEITGSGYNELLTLARQSTIGK